ncbi:hypothetical protein [Saccharothrix sp.]|uniref:hypothetical protein n=1 Tax=Saccharothrix sp. TaxID=1873460 RepID=UPI00281247B0|nr:hypothetical protein [Saccharothrix sp.]
MRTLGKLVLATAAALVLAAPVANAAPPTGIAAGGPTALVQPLMGFLGPLLGGLGG